MDIDKRPGLNDIFTPFRLHSTTRNRDALRNRLSFRSTAEIDFGFTLGVVPFTFEGLFSEISDHSLMALGVDSYTERLRLKALVSNRIDRVTPVAIEKGYQISEEDYIEGAREKKLQGLRQRHALLIEDDDEFPLTFAVYPSEELFTERNFGSFEYGELGFKFVNPLEENFIRRLRLQVSFPSWLKYEARPSEIGLVDGGYLAFSRFYPLGLTPRQEPGPLANPFNGVELLLPDTFVDLAKIQTRFVLAKTL